MAARRRRRQSRDEGEGDSEVHQAFVYDPIDRIRRPFDPWAHDEPIAIHMIWTDEALALLVLMHEIVTLHVQQIQVRMMLHGEDKFLPHLRLGLQTLDVIGTLVAHKPKLLILEPTAFVDNTILLYLDAMVGVLREVGPIKAGELLRSMGWRPKYAGSYYSPTYSGQAKPPPQAPVGRGVYYSPTASPAPSRSSYSPMPSLDPRYRPVYRSPEGRSGAGHVYESPDPHAAPKARPTFVSKRAK